MPPTALLIRLLPWPLESAPLAIHWAISLFSYLPPSFVASRISLTCAVLVGISFVPLTVLFPQIYSECSSFCVPSLVFLGIHLFLSRLLDARMGGDGLSFPLVEQVEVT
jgi:hypothetical protein